MKIISWRGLTDIAKFALMVIAIAFAVAGFYSIEHGCGSSLTLLYRTLKCAGMLVCVLMTGVGVSNVTARNIPAKQFWIGSALGFTGLVGMMTLAIAYIPE